MPNWHSISAFANVKSSWLKLVPYPSAGWKQNLPSKRLRGKYIRKTELVPENDAWKTTSLSLPGNFSQAIVLSIHIYIYIHVYSCIQSVNTVNTIHAYYIHINIQVYQLWALYEKKHGETPIRSTRRLVGRYAGLRITCQAPSSPRVALTCRGHGDVRL